LAELTSCSISLLFVRRKEYAKINKEVKPINFKELSAKNATIIFAALDKNPNIPTIELAKLADCSKDTAHRHKKQWLELHKNIPKKPNSQEVHKKNQEIIFAALDKNILLSNIELGQLANCSKDTACKIKQQYAKMRKIILPNTLKSAKQNKEAIFTLLETNPCLTRNQLMNLTGFGRATVQRWKKAWLEQQSEQGEPQDDAS
jgi:hypothetical protein